MKLYVGSRDIKPQGYLTVDIDSSKNPDIIADILNMNMIENDSCEEIIASHVLEHLEWPDGFKALAEMSRILKSKGILKVAVPDLCALLGLLSHGNNDFHIVGLIFGVGGRENKFERHRYGYSAGMLIEILELLGFGNFDWWNSSRPEGANGWSPAAEGKSGISLNIQAEKQGPPVVDPKLLYQSLCHNPMASVVATIVNLAGQSDIPILQHAVPHLYQRIHFQLIEARQRIAYLEHIINQRDFLQ